MQKGAGIFLPPFIAVMPDVLFAVTLAAPMLSAVPVPRGAPALVQV